MKSRGFWPIAKGKSKGKSVKGKFNKGHSSSRKSLQHRIMNSVCRICLKPGHWKAECPQRSDAAASKPPQAPTTFAQVVSSDAGSALSLEFLELPSADGPTLDVTQPHEVCVLSHVHTTEDNPRNRLANSLKAWNKANPSKTFTPSRIDDHKDQAEWRKRLHDRAQQSDASPNPTHMTDAQVFFATHGSLGVVDLGATKTVIGSNQVTEFLASLEPTVKDQVKRCKCQIVFRFGNQQTLKSEQAMVIPIDGLLLKIAIVPGSTPFLLSNTLLRALGAIIDTEMHTMFVRRTGKTIPLTLTSKGLFLLDVNHLASSTQDANEQLAETHTLSDANLNQFSSPEKMSASSPESLHVTQTNSHVVQSSAGSNVRTDHSTQVNSVDAETSRSKIPEPLSVPSNVTHHGLVQETSEPPDANEGRETRLLSTLPGRDGQHESGVRQTATGQEVQRRLEERTIMDSVVHTALREQQQERAPDPAPLHRMQGGSCRESPGSARDQSPIVVGQAAKSDDPGPAKGDAQDVCHAQDDSPKCHHDSRPRDPSGDGSLGSRPRFRPLRTHSGTGECDHSEQSRAQGSTDHQSGTTALPDGECLVPSDPIHREPGGEPGEPDLRECPSQMAIHEAGV